MRRSSGRVDDGHRRRRERATARWRVRTTRARSGGEERQTDRGRGETRHGRVFEVGCRAGLPRRASPKVRHTSVPNGALGTTRCRRPFATAGCLGGDTPDCPHPASHAHPPPLCRHRGARERRRLAGIAQGTSPPLPRRNRAALHQARGGLEAARDPHARPGPLRRTGNWAAISPRAAVLSQHRLRGERRAPWEAYDEYGLSPA
jgi:hypothetical protein